MSIQFSDTTQKDGMIQILERELKLGDGTISGNSTLLKEFTSWLNLGLAEAWAIIFGSNNTWQWDDTNHTADYPIITTNIVSGQRDYAFLTDNTGNLILDIYRVMRKNNDGVYEEIFPVDVQSDPQTEEFYDGLDVGGIPDKYDKTANGIFLSPIPNYNSTDGLKVYINREGSFFASTDTSKKPGFAGIFHEYPVLCAKYKYAVANGMANKNDFYEQKQIMAAQMKKYYARRDRDIQPFLSAEPINPV